MPSVCLPHLTSQKYWIAYRRWQQMIIIKSARNLIQERKGQRLLSAVGLLFTRCLFHITGEIKLPQGYCDSDLTLDKEFAILLPRRRGLGLCSTALVSYLISLHNDLVYTIEKYTTNAANRYVCLYPLNSTLLSVATQWPYCCQISSELEFIILVCSLSPPICRYQVSPAEVADLHVITYEVERDLIPLILSNCQYSVEKGRDTLQEFDLKKIQEQVTSRFLQGKPLITLTVCSTVA